jgi:hypothetical protein
MTENQVEIKKERRRETQKGWTCTQHEVTGADKDFRLLGCHRVKWYVRTFRRSYMTPSSVSSIILDIQKRPNFLDVVSSRKFFLICHFYTTRWFRKKGWTGRNDNLIYIQIAIIIIIIIVIIIIIIMYFGFVIGSMKWY